MVDSVAEQCDLAFCRTSVFGRCTMLCKDLFFFFFRSIHVKIVLDVCNAMSVQR